MSSLQQFKSDDGIEIVINTQTGESFASQSATARMCGCGESKIRYFITSQKIKTKTSEIPTGTGFKTSQLLDEDGIMECLDKYNSTMLKKFAKIGLRAFLHKLAGYEVTSNAIAHPQPPQPHKYYIGMVRETAKIWDEHFDSEFIYLAEITTDQDWNHRCMSRFINKTVYDYFPKEARQELDRVNPVMPSGCRARKQHQHLDCEQSLKHHIAQVKTCMRIANGSLQEFWILMDRNFNGIHQLGIPGIDPR